MRRLFIVNRLKTHIYTCVHTHPSLCIYLFIIRICPSVYPRFVYLSAYISAGMCVGMYLRLSQIEFPSMSGDSMRFCEHNNFVKAETPIVVVSSVQKRSLTLMRSSDGTMVVLAHFLTWSCTLSMSNTFRPDDRTVCTCRISACRWLRLETSYLQSLKRENRSTVMFPRSHEKKPELLAFKANHPISVHFGSHAKSLGEIALYSIGY